MIDITARRSAEEALRKSEQRFRSLAQLSADWYWEQNEQLRFSYIAEEGRPKTMAPPEALLGRTRHELDFAWSRTRCEKRIARTWRRDGPSATSC